MNENTLYKVWHLAPQQEIEVNQSGRFMYVEQCDGDASISLDDSAPFKIRSGFEFANRDFQKFRLVSNIGAGGAGVTIRIYAGHIYVSNRNPLVYVRPVPTYVIGRKQTFANVGDTYAIPATNTRTGQTTADRQIRVRVQNISPMANPAQFEIYLGATQVGLLTASSTVPHEFEIFELNDQLTLKSTLSTGAIAGIVSWYELPV